MALSKWDRDAVGQHQYTDVRTYNLIANPCIQCVKCPIVLHPYLGPDVFV